MASSELLSGISATNNMSANDNDSRPEQKVFSQAEKEYLMTFFEEYMVSSSSGSTKKKWVTTNVYHNI